MSVLSQPELALDPGPKSAHVFLPLGPHIQDKPGLGYGM